MPAIRIRSFNLCTLLLTSSFGFAATALASPIVLTATISSTNQNSSNGPARSDANVAQPNSGPAQRISGYGGLPSISTLGLCCVASSAKTGSSATSTRETDEFADTIENALDDVLAPNDGTGKSPLLNSSLPTLLETAKDPGDPSGSDPSLNPGTDPVLAKEPDSFDIGPAVTPDTGVQKLLAAAIPEPGTLVLFAAGLFGLGVTHRRRKNSVH
jgi:hypothetical protein